MIKIFYKKIPKKVRVGKGDIGIFVNKNKNFPGTQYLLKDFKNRNMYLYQKFFSQIATKNKYLFNIGKINVENASVSFFIRTYNSLSIESLGNALTLIDILEDIFSQKSIYKEYIICYTPNKEVKSIFEQFFKAKKIKRYKIIIYRNKVKEFILNLLFKNIYILYFTRIIIRWILGKREKKRKKEKICFMKSLESKIEPHKNAKDFLRKKGISFDILEYDTKNSFLSNYLNIKYYINLIKLIKNSSNIYIGEFLTKEDLIRILKIYKNKRKELKKREINSYKYKNIDIIKIVKKFLKLYINLYLLIIIESLVITKKILKKYNIIIYSYNDDPLLEILSILPKKNKKRISLQYELIYPGCTYYFYKKNPSIELVWNIYSKRVLEKKYKYPKESIINIGNIRFRKVQKKEKEKTKVNIVFTSQDAYPEALDLFLSSIKNIKNKNLNYIIKPHPAESIKEIHKKIKEINLNNKVKIISNPIEDVLKITDILISYSSTTLLEAIYNNIPIIIINPYKKQPHGVPIYKYVPYFRKKEELINFLEHLNIKELKKLKIPKILKIGEFNEKLFKKLIS